MTWPRGELLAELLAKEEAEAVLVLAGSSRDPDLLPFVGGARLGDACVLADGSGARLVYFTSMEREEAALAEAGGVELIHPADFDMETLRREGKNSEQILVAALDSAFDRAGIGTRVGSPSPADRRRVRRWQWLARYARRSGRRSRDAG